jgi:hypothetical protein
LDFFFAGLVKSLGMLASPQKLRRLFSGKNVNSG